MWDFEPTEEFGRRAKRFGKDAPRELKAAVDNLNRVQRALQEGANPLDLPLGCIHKEQRGVLAVDQKGGGKNLRETRLYVYLERDTQTIHLITLGDKGTQKADIRFASQFVESLTAQREKGESHG